MPQQMHLHTGGHSCRSKCLGRSMRFTTCNNSLPVQQVHIAACIHGHPRLPFAGYHLMTQPHQAISQTQEVIFTLSGTKTPETHCT